MSGFRGLRPALLALVFVGGCSQIIGLSDYEIEPGLDGAAGESDARGGEGGSSNDAAGGTQGGEPQVEQGGEPGVGGEPPIAQAGAAGEGGAPPVVIDCDSAECCDDEGGVVVETELVLNGDFEMGRSAWSGGYGTATFGVIVKVTDTSIDANSGLYYAWLGGVADDTCYVASPAFTIPSGTQWITASGYRFFAFDSETSKGDKATLVLEEPDLGEVTEVFDFWDNYEFDGEAWEEFSYSAPAAAYAGNEYELAVVASTDTVFDDPPDDPDAQKASNFFFDDLSLKAGVCVAR